MAVSFRILIVDDEPRTRSIVQKIIQRHEAWIVCGEAADGVEAIKRARELKPDLIPLDISMPNLDGLERPAANQRALAGFSNSDPDAP